MTARIGGNDKPLIYNLKAAGIIQVRQELRGEDQKKKERAGEKAANINEVRRIIRSTVMIPGRKVLDQHIRSDSRV